METSYCQNINKKRHKFDERINISEFLQLSRINFFKETPAVHVAGVFEKGDIVEYAGLVYLRYEFSDVIEFEDSKKKFEDNPYVIGFNSQDLSQIIYAPNGELLDEDIRFAINLFVQCDITNVGFLNYETYYEEKLYPHCAKLFLDIAIPDASASKSSHKLNYVYDLSCYVNETHRLIDITGLSEKTTSKLTILQKEQVVILDSICTLLARQALPIAEDSEDLHIIACVLFSNFDYNLALNYLTKLLNYSNRVEKVDIKDVLTGAIETINETKSPAKKFDFEKLIDYAKVIGWKRPISNELKSILVRNSKGNPTIESAAFRRYLELNGYCIYKYAKESRFIHHVNNVCTEVTLDQIQSFVMDEIRKSESSLLDTLFSNSTKRLIDNRSLKSLIDIGKIGIPTALNVSYLAFQNTVVMITKDGLTLIDYSKLTFRIWENDVIPHKFTGFDKEYRQGYFARFIRNVSGGAQFQSCFEGALGYLCHGYKDVAFTKMITLTDYAIAASKEDANGGTGKSIFIEAVKNTVPCLLLPSLQRGKGFEFQGLELFHKVAYFGDADSDFHFKALFDMITNDMRTEEKHKKAVVIPFANSPKFLLATNHTIRNITDSALRRLYTLEFREYYSRIYSPKEEFGKRMFTEFDEADWNTFYSYVIRCISGFIANGMPELESQNSLTRQLQDLTCAEFVEFASEFKVDTDYESDKTYNDFNEKYPEVSEGLRGGLNRSIFGKWLNRKCAVSGWVLEKKSKMEFGVTLRTYNFKKK